MRLLRISLTLYTRLKASSLFLIFRALLPHRQGSERGTTATSATRIKLGLGFNAGQRHLIALGNEGCVQTVPEKMRQQDAAAKQGVRANCTWARLYQEPRE